MQSLLTFILPVMLSVTGGDSVLLDGHVMMVLAGVGEAVALSAVAALLLSWRTEFTVTWRVLGISACLIAGTVILSLLGVAIYSNLANHGGIMLAAPDGPSTIVIAQAS